MAALPPAPAPPPEALPPAVDPPPPLPFMKEPPFSHSTPSAMESSESIEIALARACSGTGTGTGSGAGAGATAGAADAGTVAPAVADTWGPGAPGFGFSTLAEAAGGTDGGAAVGSGTSAELPRACAGGCWLTEGTAVAVVAPAALRARFLRILSRAAPPLVCDEPRIRSSGSAGAAAASSA